MKNNLKRLKRIMEIPKFRLLINGKNKDFEEIL